MREINQQQAASQNTRNTSCVDEMANDDDDDDDEIKGKEVSLTETVTEKETSPREIEMKNSTFGDNCDGNDNDQNCV